MKAIILAAGTSSRLIPLTRSLPKCLLKLGGKTLLQRQLDLLKSRYIDNISIITGYKHEMIEAATRGQAKCYYYSNFAQTNNLYTLHSHQHLLEDDCLILFSDVVVEPDLLELCDVEGSDIQLYVDFSKNLSGTMRVLLKDGELLDIGSQVSTVEGDGNFIGLLTTNGNGSKALRSQLKSMAKDKNHIQDYYTKALPFLAQSGLNISTISVEGKVWFEVDTMWDLFKAIWKIRQV